MLVGRERELEHLGALVASNELVVLAGPSGIGKTSLGRALLAPFDGYREGGALASLAWSPLLVFRRLLRADPGDSPDAVARAVLRDGGRPLLLDDLQWADDASLDVIAQLQGRVPIVATVRLGEERSDDVAGALELVGAHRTDLSALADEAAARLVDQLHPALGDRERAELLAVAAGHPLLLTELPQGARAAPGLVGALADRTATLDADGRRAFARLCVLGRPAPAPLLGPGSAQLLAAGLAVEAADGLEVRHGLLAEIEVERLGVEADEVRRSLVAVVDPAEGAHLLAAAGDRPAARKLALQAAADPPRDRRAKAELLALAVRCADDLDIDRRLEAVRLLTRTSQGAAARQLCAVEGRADLPPFDRGRLCLAEAEAAWTQGDHQGSARLLTTSVELLAGTDTVWEVLALAASTVIDTFVGVDGRPALERARRAVALADRIGEGHGYARYRLASVLATAGEPGWAEAYQAALQAADDAHDRDLRRDVLSGQLLAHWVRGEVDAAEGLARRELTRQWDPGDEGTRLTAAAYAAVLGLLAGRPRPELLAEFRPILDQEPAFRGRPFLEVAVVLALADEGLHADAEALVAGSEARAGIEAQSRSVALWGRTEAAWLAGRWSDAVEAQARVSALHLGDYPGALMARLIGAHATVDGGGTPEGPAPASAAPAWRAATDEWAGLVARADGRAEEAAERFLAAADQWAGADRRSEARSRWAAGDVLVAVDRRRAVALLEQAEAGAESAGVQPISERVRRSLRAAGVARRAPTVHGVGGLTAREEQVLDLVGAGGGSSAVAVALGVEPSTVDSLIRSAMRRLGTPTRAAAVVRLAELRSDAGRPRS